MKNIANVRKKVEGITLIALVITIIVLLILAGITIVTLTGENGILKKVNDAKIITTIEEEKEQIKLAYNVVKANKIQEESKEKIAAEELETELKKQNPNVTVVNKTIEEKNKIEVTFDKTGNMYIVDDLTGEISKVELPVEPEKSELQRAKDEEIEFDSRTTLEDDFGNKVVVPEGFKIASDSATDITRGVVIEDVSYGETEGSQFVWIPVGTVYTNSTKTETKTINLDRYTFNNKGEPIAQGANTISNYYQELEKSNYGNTIAKEINVFKDSVKENSGYYIGRYEARVETKRTASNNSQLKTATVKGTDFIYNNVTQLQAAYLARKMYGEDRGFFSDLINSYAWDTATVFLQEFDNRTTVRTLAYSIQDSLNTGNIAEKGTNNLTDKAQQDKICNIWDMASNCIEWTTETSSYADSPCVTRGGSYNYNGHNTSRRDGRSTTSGVNPYSFRVVLYFENLTE